MVALVALVALVSVVALEALEALQVIDSPSQNQSFVTKKAKPALTETIETSKLRPVGELQTSSDFGTEGNIIKEAKKIMRKLPKIKGAETSILSYMETMKDDAEKLIANTKEEYEPVALNCTAHTVAFERVANKTQEVMASIKSQDQYQKEVDALKDEMRKYTDQLSLMKETYANATHEQDLLGVQHENKTVDCLSHLDLHKRMVNMLKKLKRAMAKSKSNKK